MIDGILMKIREEVDAELEIGHESDEISEEDLLLAIAARVAHLMDTDTGLLFSYLYRLDIKEAYLDDVIHTPSDDPIAYRIAELILARQKDRLKTKEKYNQGPPIQGWEW